MGNMEDDRRAKPKRWPLLAFAVLVVGLFGPSAIGKVRAWVGAEAKVPEPTLEEILADARSHDACLRYVETHPGTQCAKVVNCGQATCGWWIINPLPAKKRISRPLLLPRVPLHEGAYARGRIRF